MDRQVFRNKRGVFLGMVAVLVALAALVGLGPWVGLFQTGPFMLAAPLLLALAGWIAWNQLVQYLRLVLDAAGLAVEHGRYRLELPWAHVRRVAALRPGEQGAGYPALVAWPVEPPTSNGSLLDRAFDRDIGAYVLLRRDNLAATDRQLAAAVDRFAPGRWRIPER